MNKRQNNEYADEWAVIGRLKTGGNRKMLKKIHAELILIRKELQAINGSKEFRLVAPRVSGVLLCDAIVSNKINQD